MYEIYDLPRLRSLFSSQEGIQLNADQMDQILISLSQKTVLDLVVFIDIYDHSDFVYKEDTRFLGYLVDKFLSEVAHEVNFGISGLSQDKDYFEILMDSERYMKARNELFSHKLMKVGHVVSEDANTLLNMAQDYLFNDLKPYMPEAIQDNRPTYLQVIVNNDKPAEPAGTGLE